MYMLHVSRLTVQIFVHVKNVSFGSVIAAYPPFGVHKTFTCLGLTDLISLILYFIDRSVIGRHILG